MPRAGNFEETGLLGRAGFRLLGDSHRSLERDGRVHDLHRTYFLLPLEDTLPETWPHFQTSPSGGGRPFYFDFVDWMLWRRRAPTLVPERFLVECRHSSLGPSTLTWTSLT